MLKKLKRNNQKGFTLIELMIVIAIIGVIAAIAVPNFISYRNKSYCTQAESDANAIASSISNYFAMPLHTALPAYADLGIDIGANSANIVITGVPNSTVTILVTDASEICSDDYQAASTEWTSGVYTLEIK